jgi:hypothetical protein
MKQIARLSLISLMALLTACGGQHSDESNVTSDHAVQGDLTPQIFTPLLFTGDLRKVTTPEAGVFDYELTVAVLVPGGYKLEGDLFSPTSGETFAAKAHIDPSTHADHSQDRIEFLCYFIPNSKCVQDGVDVGESVSHEDELTETSELEFILTDNQSRTDGRKKYKLKSARDKDLGDD